MDNLKESAEILRMQFDMNTIQHLGVSMYSTLPPVLGELVANSYDADAKKVTIELLDKNTENKSIVFQDDGYGMSFNDINNKFLIIGRNRRIADTIDTTSGGRKVIGRKGIGKLSIFGIADEIIVTTVKDGNKNSFRMYLPDLKERKNEYFPDHSIRNQQTNASNGTMIELKKLKRKSSFEPQAYAEDLARRFLIFDNNFKVDIIYNDDHANIIEVTKELRFKNIEKEFQWNFPNEGLKDVYSNENKVIGEIYSAVKPVPAAMKGIYLVARGKIVHKNDFYGARADDYAHSYITGWLNVDFIDDDKENDLISTNRESLNWENEKTEDLRKYLQKIIAFIAQSLKEKRRQHKEEKIKEKTGIDLPAWIQSLPYQDRKLAKRTTDVILNDVNTEADKCAELISYVQDFFEYGSFKEFAAQLDELKDIPAEDLIKLFKDWGIIEAKEMYKLAMVRVRTIDQFDKKIKDNAKEVPELHGFLKTFPWLLDPRIMSFKDEVTYSELLRNNFKEPDTIPEEDRRIDFLCVDLADTIFIIELKRPKTKANDKFLDQALHYSTFLKEKKGNDPEFSKRTIKTYLICDGLVNKPEVRAKAEAYEKGGIVYIRTYAELLKSARNYHQEFIDKYDELKRKSQISNESGQTSINNINYLTIGMT